MWTNKQGEAFGVVMAYLPKDGKIWMTAAERRARISAIRRFPRASVCINSTGTTLGAGKTVTYKGACVVHDDRATKDWFYPEFSRWIRPNDEKAATVFQQFLDSPHRVVIEFTPDYTLSFNNDADVGPLAGGGPPGDDGSGSDVHPSSVPRAEGQAKRPVRRRRSTMHPRRKGSGMRAAWRMLRATLVVVFVVGIRIGRTHRRGHTGERGDRRSVWASARRC